MPTRHAHMHMFMHILMHVCTYVHTQRAHMKTKLKCNETAKDICMPRHTHIAHAHMHTSFCICAGTCAQAHMHTCLCTCIRACTHTCLHVHAQRNETKRNAEHTFAYTFTHSHIRTCPQAHMPTCPYAHKPCPHGHMQLQRDLIHIQLYADTHTCLHESETKRNDRNFERNSGSELTCPLAHMPTCTPAHMLTCPPGYAMKKLMHTHVRIAHT